MDVESVRAGVEMYAGDKGGVSRAYAWELEVYAQASKVYTEGIEGAHTSSGRAGGHACGSQKQTVKTKKKLTYLTYWVLAKAWAWTRVWADKSPPTHI